MLFRNQKHILPLVAAAILASCSMSVPLRQNDGSCSYASLFDIIPQGDTSLAVVVYSPDGLRKDTCFVTSPMERIICMSSSHVAALSALSADSLIVAVSGLGYISDPDIRSRQNPPVYDIGYENSLDYERILELEPDLLVTYSVSNAEPPYISKLRSLGVPLMVLHDHLEEHPLARAEYIRLFGALTHRLPKADSLFAEVCTNYNRLKENVPDLQRQHPVKVLLNIPYGDAWYVPGKNSYMSRLIEDAAGEVLGAREGEAASRVISLEQAYELSQKADVWLNPGHCRTRAELRSAHRLFVSFGPMAGLKPIYNNTLRTTPEGGNDFWESGAMRPDLILQDLINIFSGTVQQPLSYFISLDQ